MKNPAIHANPSPAIGANMFSATPQHVRAFWRPTEHETWAEYAERALDDDDTRACLTDLIHAYAAGDTPEPVTLAARHITDGPLRVLAAHLAAVPTLPVTYQPGAPRHNRPRPWETK